MKEKEQSGKERALNDLLEWQRTANQTAKVKLQIVNSFRIMALIMVQNVMQTEAPVYLTNAQNGNFEIFRFFNCKEIEKNLFESTHSGLFQNQLCRLR